MIRAAGPATNALSGPSSGCVAPGPAGAGLKHRLEQCWQSGTLNSGLTLHLTGFFLREIADEQNDGRPIRLRVQPYRLGW